ncbi:MAG: hypothetical protein IPH52_05360 [Leptospiraceae bacterium]|nr:hypothetical protein [Leptospiraceae bacterium]
MINFVKESLNEALTTTNYTVGEMSALESVFFHKKVSEKFADGRGLRLSILGSCW